MPVAAALVPPARLRIVEAAFTAFAADGFAATNMRRIARDAGCSLGLLYRYYPSKHALAVALALDLSWRGLVRVVRLPRAPLAERVSQTLKISLALLDAHGAALRGLVVSALDPEGPLDGSDALRALQARLTAAFSVAILGAEDPPSIAEADRLARVLTAVHFSLLLLWARSPGGAPAQAIDLVEEGMRWLRPILSSGGTQAPIGRLDALFSPLLSPAVDPADLTLARRILERLFQRRRLLPGAPANVSLDAAMAPHLLRVAAVVAAKKPLHLVLTGFSGRTRNPDKVLGPAPDAAEVGALRVLGRLCDDLAGMVPSGVRLTVASDGLIFCDVLGLSERMIRTYDHQLDDLITANAHSAIGRVDLRDVFGEGGLPSLQSRLMRTWADPLEPLRARIDGLQRVLFADRLAEGVDQPRAVVRQQARERAAEQLSRTAAWRRLLATCFPDALLLSSLPQPPVSERLGLLLGTTDDVWMTPWSSVELREQGRARLVTRLEAEDLGARLMEGGPHPFFSLDDT